MQNDLFLKTVRGEETVRPPVWLMRQAGRILPEYRAIRERLSGFKELVKTPELACEVTIQPVDALQVDAAIIFSDILVIPEALGLDYEMEEKRGPRFPETIQNQNDIDQLRSAADAAHHLEYVYEAIRLTSKALNGRVPLIGFAGAPWTILAYMVEGSGSKTFSKAKRFLYAEPLLAHRLLQKITDATIAYLKNQLAAGADLIQIFDSWAGILSPAQYHTFAIPYLKQLKQALEPAPVTIFAKDAWFAVPTIHQSIEPAVIGLDWTLTPEYARRLVGEKQVLQGNADPCLLYADTKTIRAEVKNMLQSFGRHHILNLGHGVYPDTPLDGIRCFIDAAKEFRY